MGKRKAEHRREVIRKRLRYELGKLLPDQLTRIRRMLIQHCGSVAEDNGIDVDFGDGVDPLDLEAFAVGRMQAALAKRAFKRSPDD